MLMKMEIVGYGIAKGAFGIGLTSEQEQELKCIRILIGFLIMRCQFLKPSSHLRYRAWVDSIPLGA